MASLCARLRQVLELRSTHEELTHLLRDDDDDDDDRNKSSEEESKENRESALFAPFARLNPVLYNAHTEPQWRFAVGEYESSLAPVDARIAANFRKKVSSFLDAPQQLLHEFRRFAQLLSRPQIRAALTREREALLHQLIDHLEGVSESFDACVRDDPRDAFACNLSEHVSGVVAARQIATSARASCAGASLLFGDLKGFADFESLAKELSQRARKTEQELLAEWATEVKLALQGGEEGMRMRGQLMEITHAGLLSVNYSSRLVQLLREVRQLSELELNVPLKIKKAAEEGERYYRYGVMLKKVANFFNGMETQILSTQRPMLLTALVSVPRQYIYNRFKEFPSRIFLKQSGP